MLDSLIQLYYLVLALTSTFAAGAFGFFTLCLGVGGIRMLFSKAINVREKLVYSIVLLITIVWGCFLTYSCQQWASEFYKHLA